MRVCEQCRNQIPVFREYTFVLPPMPDNQGRQIIPPHYLFFCNLSCTLNWLETTLGLPSRKELEKRKNELEVKKNELEAEKIRLEEKIKGIEQKSKPKKWESKDWSDVEKQRLGELYREGKTLSEIASVIGRTSGAVSSKIHELGIAERKKKKKKTIMKERREWTEEEENLLRSVFPKSSWEELKKIFPGRTKIAISRKALKLKLRRR